MKCKNCGSERIRKNGKNKSGQPRYRCSQCHKEVKPNFDADMLQENVRLSKKNQKLSDKQRIENNSWRKNVRIENSIEEYVKALSKEIKKLQFEHVDEISFIESDKELIVQLSDLHLNELVQKTYSNDNAYDFRIASKRLYKFATRILEYVNTHNVGKISVILTGDLLNSDRRTDELLAMATNRAKATLLGVKLISQFISLLSNYANVDVISVSGNESRIREEHTSHTALASDNFDYMIYEIMNMLFENNKRVTFVFGDGFEYIHEVNGVNVLAVHGDKLGKMTGADFSKLISKWAKNGVIINFIICGHLHEAMITDTTARSSSLVGGNDYSNYGLNLYSRASQNMHFVYEDGSIESIKVDLQNVDENSPMFDIEEALVAYNAKSHTKLNKTVELVRVRS